MSIIRANSQPPLLTDEQLSRWRLHLERMQDDKVGLEQLRAKVELRTKARAEINELLQSFLDGRIDVEEIRDVFHCRTLNDWKTFGFKGFSGAMVLNMLVKHLDDRESLTHLLKEVLVVPKDEDTASESFSTYVEFMRERIESHELSENTASVKRIPFFLSAWWHVQAPEMWPVYYPTTRTIFEQETSYKMSRDDLCTDYLSFCGIHRRLQNVLGVTSWELESLCVWLDSEPFHSNALIDSWIEPSTDECKQDTNSDDLVRDEVQEDESPRLHVQLQWLLCVLGQSFGCQVWLPPRDRRAEWKEEALDKYSIKELPPLAVDPEVRRLIGEIDVIWLSGNRIEAAFEIECTTSVYSGLLRMSDLTVADPNHNFPLYIVAPAARIGKVEKELRRPTFVNLELHERCWYFSAESLIADFDSIRKWSTQPGSIKKLAHSIRP